MAGAARWQANESLTLQIPRELKLVEQLVDGMELDPQLRARFVESPVSTLVEFGIVPGDGEDAVTISRGNLIFLSMVSNKELIDWIKENLTVEPPPPEVAAIYKDWITSKGALDIPAEHQARIIQDFASNEEFMQGLVTKLYEDKAFRSSLPEGVNEAELHKLMSKTLKGLREEVALGRLPRLNPADRPVAFVVLVPVLAIAILAIALAVAVAVVVWLWVWVWGAAIEPAGELEVRAGLWELAQQFADLRGEGGTTGASS